MKKMLSILLLILLTVGTASIAMAVIKDSPHDVNKMPARGGDGDLERCAMCHTPHSGTGAYPLWNRTQGNQTYQVYENPSKTTFDMNPAADPDNDQNSHYATSHCLVCHNGVASQLVNYPGPASSPNPDYNFMENPADLSSVFTNLGTNLMDDHPIAFTYDPAKDNATENNGFPTAVDYGSASRKAIPGKGTGTKYPLYGTTKDQFECATCHSVHDTVEYDGKGISQVYFLRVDNKGSQMCTDCHVNR
ncbi:MAG: hypothetical protein C4560_14425 [Nitrospiraceae bacterium]|nr:MAG: hypothetical protein C4560_14425 [Nitrospiraceae bacterium]